MVNINRKYLEATFKEKIWTEFLKEITKVKSKNDLKRLLERLFTASELVMIEKRLAIFHLIDEGFRYREIGEMIDVAPSTISFVKKGFKKNIGNKNISRQSSTYPTFTGKGRWRFLNM